MTQTETRYISVTECATLIRKALKEQFPTIKFSVKSRSYSGGAHVTVAWTDGPTSDAVAHVCSAFEGASFDSSIDLKSYKDSTLNGEAVSFGNDWTSCNRTESPAFITAVAEAYCTRYRKPMPAIQTSSNGTSAWIADRNFSDYHDYREEIVRKIREADASQLDRLFEKEDQELAEYDAAVAARKAVEDTSAQEETPEERAIYLETELLPSLKSQLVGFEQMGASYAVEIVTKAIAKHEEELATLRPTSFAQNMAAFAQTVRAYTDTIVSDYVPQPHDWIYGSRHRPVSPSWARIPEAHYIQLDHKQNDWVFTWVVVPQELDEKTMAGYELELLQYPVAYLEDKTLVTITQELPYNEYHVRVLRAGECTSYRALIGGELKFYLKRCNALLVDGETFNRVLDARVALKASEAA